MTRYFPEGAFGAADTAPRTDRPGGPMNCDHPKGYRRTSGCGGGCVGCELDEAHASLTEMTHNAERRQAALAAARARIAAARELHHEVDEHGDGSGTWCAVCLSGEWPCETIRALDALPARDAEPLMDSVNQRPTEDAAFTELVQLGQEIDACDQLRGAAENALAHTGGERDGYVLVQAEYVEALRRSVARSWGHPDA